jgi:hypothetical protein
MTGSFVGQTQVKINLNPPVTFMVTGRLLHERELQQANNPLVKNSVFWDVTPCGS